MDIGWEGMCVPAEYNNMLYHNGVSNHNDLDR